MRLPRQLHENCREALGSTPNQKHVLVQLLADLLISLRERANEIQDDLLQTKQSSRREDKATRPLVP